MAGALHSAGAAASVHCSLQPAGLRGTAALRLAVWGCGFSCRALARGAGAPGLRFWLLLFARGAHGGCNVCLWGVFRYCVSVILNGKLSPKRDVGFHRSYGNLAQEVRVSSVNIHLDVFVALLLSLSVNTENGEIFARLTTFLSDQ